MTQLTVGEFLDRSDIDLITECDEINIICDYYDHEGEQYGFLLVVYDPDADSDYTEVYGSEQTTPKSKTPLTKIL